MANVLLDGELSENRDEYDPTEAPSKPAARKLPKAPAPAEPTAPITLTVADLKALVESAVTAAVGAQAAQSASISEAIGEGLKAVRQPIHENTDADNPRISAYNPYGEKDHPRPGLKCPMFWGVTNAKKEILATPLEFLEKNCTAREQVALNLLEPTHGLVKGSDRRDIRVSVVPDKIDDVTGHVQRLLIVVPYAILEKGSQALNNMPPIEEMVRQLTGHDVERCTDEEIKFLMREQRARRYRFQPELAA